MFAMFRGAKNFSQPLAWDTSRVTTMEQMFAGAFRFNSPLLFDTSKVVNMNSMFADALSFSKDISIWNTSKVTDMVSEMIERQTVWQSRRQI